MRPRALTAVCPMYGHASASRWLLWHTQLLCARESAPCSSHSPARTPPCPAAPPPSCRQGKVTGTVILGEVVMMHIHEGVAGGWVGWWGDEGGVLLCRQGLGSHHAFKYPARCRILALAHAPTRAHLNFCFLQAAPVAKLDTGTQQQAAVLTWHTILLTARPFHPFPLQAAAPLASWWWIPTSWRPSRAWEATPMPAPRACLTCRAPTGRCEQQVRAACAWRPRAGRCGPGRFKGAGAS